MQICRRVFRVVWWLRALRDVGKARIWRLAAKHRPFVVGASVPALTALEQPFSGQGPCGCFSSDISRLWLPADSGRLDDGSGMYGPPSCSLFAQVINGTVGRNVNFRLATLASCEQEWGCLTFACCLKCVRLWNEQWRA